MRILLAIVIVVLIILVFKISCACKAEMFSGSGYGGEVSRAVDIESCPNGTVYDVGMCVPTKEAELLPQVNDSSHIDRYREEHFNGGSNKRGPRVPIYMGAR